MWNIIYALIEKQCLQNTQMFYKQETEYTNIFISNGY